jgi:hypothetical protein
VHHSSNPKSAKKRKFIRIIARFIFAHTALFAYGVTLCNRYPAIQVCKKCAKSVQKCADGQNKAQWTNQSPVLWQGLGHPNRHRLHRNEVPHEQAAFLPLLRKSDLHSRKN